MAGRKIIEVKNLKKIYKVRDIFQQMKGNRSKVGIDDASFDVQEGEIFAIIGLNGAGKTTIMKSMLGIIKPDAGSIKIFGEEKLKKSDYYNIGYLPEISYYPKEVKLKDLMSFYADLYGMESTDKKNMMVEVFDVLGLTGWENSKIEKFSKGMIQRVGLAQAIMNSPKLLFLDEPMSGLDPLGRKMVVDLLKRLKKNGTTIILNTHILSDVETLADRIAIVNKGKVETVLNFKKKLKSSEAYRLTIDVPFSGFSKVGDKYIKMVKKEELNRKLKELALVDVNISEMEKYRESLESYFINSVL